MNKNVDKRLEAYEGEMIEALRESVMIPSVKAEPAEGAPFGREVKRALDHALDLGKKLGFETRDMDGYIGLIEYGEGEETLGIMCHLDVVPEGDIEAWKYPPYGAEIHDGEMFGRGTLDDKGPVFSTLYALKAIKDEGLKMKRRVRVMLGCDEESGWGCMDYYKAHEKMPDLAFSPDAEYPLVNSEKTILQAEFSKAFKSNIRINAGTRANVVCGKAVAFIPKAFDEVEPIASAFGYAGEFDVECKAVDSGTEITVLGLDAHASLPESGKNALLALLSLLRRLEVGGEDAEMLEMLNDKLKQDIHGETLGVDFTDASGRTTFNAGVLVWGENGIEKFVIDMRVPTSIDINKVVETLKTELPLELGGTHIQNGHYVAPESELVSKLLAVYAERTGKYEKPLAIGGGTYARAVENAVAFGCERPGVPALIHMPNESIRLEDIMFNAKMMASAIIALAVE